MTHQYSAQQDSCQLTITFEVGLLCTEKGRPRNAQAGRSVTCQGLGQGVVISPSEWLSVRQDIMRSLEWFLHMLAHGEARIGAPVTVNVDGWHVTCNLSSSLNPSECDEVESKLSHG